MDTATTFFAQHLKHGLCYPVWIDDEEDCVTRKIARDGTERVEDGDVSSMKGMDNTVVNVNGSGRQSPESNKRMIRKNKDVSTSGMESRDASAEVSLLASLRDTSISEQGSDLDEVIAKIIRKRDDLMDENTQAAEEIQKLKLENENLKNLNAISKRISASQRDELTQLKINGVQDKNKIKELEGRHLDDRNKISELEKILLDFRNRTTEAQHALDGTLFLGGIGSCQGQPIRSSKESLNEGMTINNSGILDAVFGWTIEGDD